MRTINILGTEYTFEYDDLNNPDLSTNDGVCHILDRQIVIRKPEYMAGLTDASKKRRTEHVIRHELIHAVAVECGVSYGDNEELVDWIAHIIPIVNKVFHEIQETGD